MNSFASLSFPIAQTTRGHSTEKLVCSSIISTIESINPDIRSFVVSRLEGTVLIAIRLSCQHHRFSAIHLDALLQFKPETEVSVRVVQTLIFSPVYVE